MRYLSILILLFLINTIGICQEKGDRKNRLRLGLGTYYFTNLDIQASPLIYKARAKSLQLGYLFQSEKALFSVDLSPSIGKNRPKNFGVREFEGEKYHFFMDPNLYNANLTINYERKIWENKGTNRKFFLGGTLDEALMISDAVANFYWSTNLLSLNVSGTLKISTGERHHFLIKGSLPVYSFISRAVYSNFPKSGDQSNFKAFFERGTQGATWDKFQRVNLEVNYNFNLSNRFDIGLLYKFYWFRYPDPQLIKAYSNQLLLQTAYKF